jgi:hypothetical protein
MLDHLHDPRGSSREWRDRRARRDRREARFTRSSGSAASARAGAGSARRDGSAGLGDGGGLRRGSRTWITSYDISS